MIIPLIMIFIIIIIIYTIVLSFGNSLENIQYYSSKYLYLDFFSEDKCINSGLSALKWCVTSCILYSNEKLFRYLVPNSWVFYDKFNKPSGFIKKVDDVLLISFISTSNLDHVITATNNKINCYGFHDGYYNRVNNIINDNYDTLNMIIRNNNNNIKRIILCGHSMAGALCGISSNILGKMYPSINIICYCFGSPKFCTKNVEWSNNIVLYDYINLSDPVVYKPLNNNYIRYGIPFYHSIDTKNDNVNHSIKVYREIILKKEKTDIPNRPHRTDEIISRWFLDLLG